MFSSSKRTSATLLSSIASIVLFAGNSQVFADQHTAGVPLLSSRPGAAYTVFIDPAGFNFNGTWGGGSTPGNNLAINNIPANGTFGAADVTEIKAIYAAMANQFRSFNVNVTTIDPAIAAGQAGTDVARQAYYDSQARMMHTIVGPGGTPGWHTGADGLALLGTIDHVETGGAHTNFMFTEAQDGNPTIANGNYIGNIDGHETGHTFGLHHQGDFTGTTVTNEYTFGDDANGNGNYVATMGNASDRQRVAWRVGSANGAPSQFQNDVKTIASNNGISFADSGIGHTFATSTALPVVGGSIDLSSPLHRGTINPIDAANPNPIGVNNYTKDVFSFTTDGLTPISLTLNDGNDLLTPGTVDNGATLRGTLSIYNSLSQLIATGIEDASTMFATYSGLLTAGTYYAQIASFGGHNEVTSAFNAAQYYDMGGYFLTGSGFAAVPEPTMIAIFAIGLAGVLRRRRNVMN